MYLKTALFASFLLANASWAEDNKVFICGDNWAEIEIEYFDYQGQANAYFAGDSLWSRSHSTAFKAVAEENKFLFKFTDELGGYLKIQRDSTSARWLGFVKETNTANEYSVGFCEPTT
jgi:hypothetical protein